MRQDPVADDDRLVARVEADVDMQSECHQPPGRFLQQVDQAQVTLVGGDLLLLPSRERVSPAPEERASPGPWRFARRS